MARTIPAFRSSRPPTKSKVSLCLRIEHHAIDGEIAALYVFTRIFAEAHLVGMTAIGVAHIGTKSRYLDRLPQRWRQEHVALFPRSAHRARYDLPLEGVCSRRFVAFVFLRVLCGISFEGHQYDSELLAYGEGLGEDLHDLPRSCVGRNVVVGGLAAEQQVADTSAGEVGLVPAFAQRVDDFGGVLFGVRHRRLVVVA